MLWIDQAGQHGRVISRKHIHRLIATADRHFRLRELIGRDARHLANFLRHDDRAIERLGHVLQPRRDVYRIADRGEHRMVAKTDVPDNDLAALNPDAESDRLAQLGGKLMIIYSTFAATFAAARIACRHAVAGSTASPNTKVMQSIELGQGQGQGQGQC